jgi:protoheme IX farnesyltransferase
VVVLAVFSWAVYVTVYTPLKSSTPWQTPIGAVAGAMPMLLGAAVAGGPCSPTAWTLFGIVFFWQFPHAMAIAWLYRDQFAEADVKLATVLDPSGRQAAVLAVAGAVVLWPLGAIPRWTVPTGWGYAICALCLGAGYLAASVAFFLHRDDRTARRLLRASLVYLSGLFAALLLS